MNILKIAFSGFILLSLFNCAEDSRESLELVIDQDRVITFEDDVQQLISQDCLNCHTNPPRNGAPFSLITFDEVSSRAAAISNSINGRTILMPPGVNLPQSRISIIDRWIEQGMLEN